MHEPLMTVTGWLLHHLPEYVLHYLTQSIVMLAMVGGTAWLGDRILRKAGPQAQHRLWVGALLASVALPWLPAGWLAHFGHADAGAAGGTATVTYHMVAAAAERWTVSPLLCAMLAAAYLLSVLFCVARLLWRWWRTAAMARRGVVLPLGASACSLLESVARRFGVATPEVRFSSETRGPVVLGLRRALLLVPQGFFAAESLAPDHREDIAAALAHECAHIARRDFAKHLLYQVVAAAVAYHPACWLMQRRIAETRELVCDEMAAAAVGDRPEYAASLLRLATALAGPGRRTTPAIGVFDGEILEERIMRLTMGVPKLSRAQWVAMVALTACVLLGGVGTATALSFDVTSQDSAPAHAPVQEKVYKVGGDVTAPVLVHAVDAEFTKKAKDAKYQGVSVVGCVVDSKGMPRHVHTIRKLGMGLDEKALEAVRQYKFEPGKRDGKPVAVAINIEVNFHLY